MVKKRMMQLVQIVFMVECLVLVGFLAVSHAQDKEQELFEAAWVGDIEQVKSLIGAGVDADSRDKKGATLSMVEKADKTVNFVMVPGKNVIPRRGGMTALVAASTTGQIEVVKILIAAKANVNAKGINGFTPLFLAECNGHKEVAKILVDAGAK